MNNNDLKSQRQQSYEKLQQHSSTADIVGMSDTIKSQISALMDSEIDLDETPHLMTAMKAGNAAAETWQSYHLIGDVMRGNRDLSANFKSTLMQKLAAEPTVFVPNIVALKTSRMPSAWSVAASVAAVAFVSWFAMQQQGTLNSQAPQQIAESIPQDYLMAHQSMAPSNSAYFVQDAAFTESK